MSSSGCFGSSTIPSSNPSHFQFTAPIFSCDLTSSKSSSSGCFVSSTIPSSELSPFRFTAPIFSCDLTVEEGYSNPKIPSVGFQFGAPPPLNPDRSIPSFQFGAPKLTKRSISPTKDTSTSAHAATSETTNTVINLKIIVEKTNHRVVFVESGTDFIDLLFSFLTLPIVTILRPLEQKTPPTILGSVGCMNNIIASVENLDARVFSTEACKEILLHPRRLSEVQCSNKNFNIEDYLEQRKYFYFCRNLDCRKDGNPSLSVFPNVRCKCGQVMDQLATLSEPIGRASSDHDEGEGVFVKNRGEMFLISDDLQVVSGSTSSSITLLKKLGIVDANELETQSVNLGTEEILQLLRLSLVSKTPLTHWILLKEGVRDLKKIELENTTELPNNRSPRNNSKKIRLTLIKSKSENTILYAESEEDFIDFLFSFLTFPLGSMIKLLDGKSSLGCIDNIYQSVKDMGTNNYLKSEDHKNMLLAPKLAPFCAWENSMFHIDENLHPQYSLNYCVGDRVEWRVAPLDTEPNCYSVLGKMLAKLSVVNPKYSPRGTPCDGGFVKGPAKFMVTDSLVVTQLSPSTSISFLAKLNVPITDVDEIVVEVGEEEALNLLKAALISERALTDVFKKA